MLQQELCPDCNDLIPAERMDEDMVICNCGYTFSQSQINFERKRNKKASYTIILTSLILVTSFIHTAKWGSDAVRVTPLEMSRVLGTISPDQALYLGDMSMEKGFYDQAEKMYEIYLAKNTENLKANEKMGMLLFKKEKFEESIPYLGKYYSLGGEDKDSVYSLGKALTKVERFDEAETVYLSIINKDPEMYQITVVQALVDLYVLQDKLSQANEFVSSLIKSGYEVPTHLQEQKAHIRELLKKKS